MVRQRLKWVSNLLPALVHGRQSHVLARDSQEAVQTSCCFSQVRLEKRMPQTWHLVACGTKRAVSPDLWPHGLGFMEVPRERGTRGPQC